MREFTRLETLLYLYGDTSAAPSKANVQWLVSLPPSSPHFPFAQYFLRLSEVRRLRHSVLGAPGFQQTDVWDLAWRRIKDTSRTLLDADEELERAWVSMKRCFEAKAARQAMSDHFASANVRVEAAEGRELEREQLRRRAG